MRRFGKSRTTITDVKRYNNKENRKKNRLLKTHNRSKIIYILIVLAIALLTVKIVLDAVNPIFDTICETKAKSMATAISNKEATNVMKEHSYDEIFSIEKDKNGNVSMIKSNMIPINQIISDVAIRIQEDLDKSRRENIEIASGSFTGIKLLSGKGPGVKIRISPVGNVETDLKSEFLEKGVNQTLHRVYLKVDVKVNILTPFQNSQKDITNQVLLMENVIVGQIPQNYYNFKSNDDENIATEVIE